MSLSIPFPDSLMPTRTDYRTENGGVKELLAKIGQDGGE
jgi:hypothetical protein